MGREEEIRIIAYALWVRDGYKRQSAIKHWLEAEAIWEQNHKMMEILKAPPREPGRKSADLAEAGHH